MVIPDAIEPVAGWKSWVLGGEAESPLLSPSYPLLWKPGRKMKANCQNPLVRTGFQPLHEHSPHLDCSCGIHIANSPHTAFGYGSILGEVYGWGKVIEHEYGYRVEFSYPKMFYVTQRALARTLRVYDVPIMTLSAWELVRLLNIGDNEELERMLEHRITSFWGSDE